VGVSLKIATCVYVCDWGQRSGPTFSSSTDNSHRKRQGWKAYIHVHLALAHAW